MDAHPEGGSDFFTVLPGQTQRTKVQVRELEKRDYHLGFLETPLDDKTPVTKQTRNVGWMSLQESAGQREESDASSASLLSDNHQQLPSGSVCRKGCLWTPGMATAHCLGPANALSV